MTDRISGVVLAGGAGSRFNGLIKSRILINGETIISRIISSIGGIFDEIIIVTNTPDEFIEFRNYKIVGDLILNAGPLGGIHAGLSASSKEAVFVFAGDMPFLDKRLILSMIDDYMGAACDALIPRIGGFIEPLHSIYNNSVINRLEEYLRNDRGCAVRDFIELLDVKYMKLEGSADIRRAFTNINSPDDL